MAAFYFFPLGGPRSRGAACAHFANGTKINKIKTPKIILITQQKQEQLLVWLCVLFFTSAGPVC